MGPPRRDTRPPRSTSVRVPAGARVPGPDPAELSDRRHPAVLPGVRQGDLHGVSLWGGVGLRLTSPGIQTPAPRLLEGEARTISGVDIQRRGSRWRPPSPTRRPSRGWCVTPSRPTPPPPTPGTFPGPP